MRFSTGIILSILSANVFAIEHFNDAHPGSLLARRAVVADTDGFSLEKRNNGKEQEKRDKSKVSPISNFGKEAYAYENPAFEDYPNPDPNYNDDTGERNTNPFIYVPNQDREANDGREDVRTDVALDQERSSFADASRGSSSQVLGHIRKGLYRTKHSFGLHYRMDRAFAAYEKVWHYIGGSNGRIIGWYIYSMLIYALQRSKKYKLLYRNSAESPFRLKLLSSASDKQRRIYKSLQNEVQKSIKNHILDIETAIESIFSRPRGVVPELENMLRSADRFYLSISNMISEYSRLLSSLRMSGSGHLTNLDAHMILLGVYKCNLSDRLNFINEFIGNNIKPPNQEGSSKFSSSTLGSKKLSATGSKPSDDVASSSTQSNAVVSSNVQSDVAVVDDLVIF